MMAISIFTKARPRLLDLAEMFGSELEFVEDDAGKWQAHPKYQGEIQIIDGNTVTQAYLKLSALCKIRRAMSKGPRSSSLKNKTRTNS
jgi:hypothetical protein